MLNHVRALIEINHRRTERVNGCPEATGLRQNGNWSKLSYRLLDKLDLRYLLLGSDSERDKIVFWAATYVIVGLKRDLIKAFLALLSHQVVSPQNLVVGEAKL